MEGKAGPICQSCGMPIVEDQNYGTNADGTKTDEYCHYCFRDGEFAEPFMSLDQMIDKLTIIGMDKLQLTEEEARAIATTTLPKLKRWKKE